MNIIEAAKSGRDMRRVVIFCGFPSHKITKPADSDSFSREDIMADDWEVEEETVTITRGQLAAAIVAYGESDVRRTLLIGFVAKKLGFKE